MGEKSSLNKVCEGNTKHPLKSSAHFVVSLFLRQIKLEFTQNPFV
jgi:hypothetical protein